MSETEEFRADARAWLQEHCPSGARGPGVIPWGSRKVDLPTDSRVWLENMAAKGWTVPTWPKASVHIDISQQSAQQIIEPNNLQNTLPKTSHQIIY